MPTLKKLTFAPLFLIVFTILIYQLSSVFKSYDFIFSLSFNTLLQLITVCIFISLSGFLFILFNILAFDWKFILPIGIAASLTPLLFFDQITGLFFGVGIFVSLLISYFSLESTMKSYLNFQPITLFGPLIRHLTGILILTIALIYFLVINKVVVQKGFELPDSFIDTALKFSPIEQANSLPALPQEQVEMLRKNPQLLKQSGIDPKILDSLGAPAQATNNFIKQTLKSQIQGLIKPYLGYIPFILAMLLFLTLQSLTSLINLLIYPLLWFTFFILEKSGFIKFTTEMRPIKKMIV